MVSFRECNFADDSFYNIQPTTVSIIGFGGRYMPIFPIYAHRNDANYLYLVIPRINQ